MGRTMNIKTKVHKKNKKKLQPKLTLDGSIQRIDAAMEF